MGFNKDRGAAGRKWSTPTSLSVMNELVRCEFTRTNALVHSERAETSPDFFSLFFLVALYNSSHYQALVKHL